jgi:hypothetical protein
MPKPRFSLAVIASVFAATSVGCSSQGEVNIGDQTTQLKTGLDAFAANWDGYIEAYTFSDGSDRVRIAIDGDGGTGAIRFGDADLLPAPTDPNVKFPPNYPPAGGVLGNPLPSIWSGHLFSLSNVRVDVERLRASTQSMQVFGGWCALQTSYLIDTGIYSCATCDFVQTPRSSADICVTLSPCPNGTSPGVINTTDVMCEQQALCEQGYYDMGVRTGTFSAGTCVCDASGCSLGTPADNILLDAALDSTQQTMTGTLAFGGTNYTIRLTRQ